MGKQILEKTVHGLKLHKKTTMNSNEERYAELRVSDTAFYEAFSLGKRVDVTLVVTEHEEEKE